MDIERINTVPLAEETVLWFEFLLKPEMLDKHVTNETKAMEIMSEFLNITQIDNSQQSNEVSSPPWRKSTPQYYCATGRDRESADRSVIAERRRAGVCKS